MPPGNAASCIGTEQLGCGLASRLTPRLRLGVAIAANIAKLPEG
jgi:hypothetical protein